MSNDSLTCELLVIGAGMAGMTAAGRAAEMGARVIVVEKAASIGVGRALAAQGGGCQSDILPYSKGQD